MSKQEANFDKFHLVGHSMGAFIASCFALQFPHKVLSLVLASPVGLPRAPAQKIPRGLPFLRATLYAFVFMLWECGYTPQGAVRALGANFGRRLSAWIIAPRLPTSDGNTRAAIAEYFYQISSARGSGEFALSTVLESGAYARRPLCDRLGDVKVGTVFLYGDRDWMSSEVAHGICENMKVRTRVKIVENAGHHLYYDNVQMFGDMVKEACDEADEEHRRKENNADVAHMLTDQLTARQREQTL